MNCTRHLTALVIITGVACWTDPFNWHFLPKHYRLYSKLTVDHTVQFDTDCGTLAADSGATHFLWDPESGLCSISYGLTAADFSVANQQDSKTSFYYVRDVALVVPPGNPNCPTEAQLKRMIDNLLWLNGSFVVQPDATRRTWRNICKKNEDADATNAKARESTPSPTKSGTTMNESSTTTPVTIPDSVSHRTSSSAVDIDLDKADSSSTVPATPKMSTTPMPITENLNPAWSGTPHGPFASVTSAKTTAFEETDRTMKEESLTTTPANTPSVMTDTDSPTAAATASRSTTGSRSTVSSAISTHGLFASVTRTEAAKSEATDTSTYESLTAPSSKATTASPTISGQASTILYTTDDETTSNSKTHADSPSLSSTAVPSTNGLKAPWETTIKSDPGTTVTTSTASVSGMHWDTTSPSNFATNFTAPWKTTMKSVSKSTSSPAKSNPVTTVLASSISSGPAQESTTTSKRTATTNTTTSAIPPFSATATTTEQPEQETAGTNRKTARVASAASSAVKSPSTTKLRTTMRKTTKRTTPKRPATKPPPTKRPTPKRTTPKRTTPKRTTPRRTTPRRRTPKRTTKFVCEKPSKAVPLYQTYGKNVYNYIYTTDLNKAKHTRGYKFEGMAGRILPTKAPGSYALYRLYHPGRQAHFYTMFEKGRGDAIRQGFRDEGIVGYVYRTSADKSRCPCKEVRPLYRLVKKAPIEKNFYTTNVKEKDRAIRKRSYKLEEIAACMYPI